MPRHNTINKASQQKCCSEEARLFTHDGVDEVGFGFGQVQQLLLALHKTDTNHAAGPDCDLRLALLVAGIAGGGRVVACISAMRPFGSNLVDQLVIFVDEVDRRGLTGRVSSR